jgi:hypothetical protein
VRKIPGPGPDGRKAGGRDHREEPASAESVLQGVLPFDLSREAIRFVALQHLATLAGLDKSLRAFYKPDTSRPREPR